MANWNSKQFLKDHVDKMKYSVSNANGAIEYKKVMTYEEYKESLIEGMGSLGYPLRKEVKRDRFVLNSEGLRQTMHKACELGCQNMESEIYAFIQNEVKQEISRAIEDVLNSVYWNGSQFNTNFKSQSSSLEKKLLSMASHLGKALADDIMYIFNDMMNGGNGKKKKKK